MVTDFWFSCKSGMLFECIACPLFYYSYYTAEWFLKFTLKSHFLSYILFEHYGWIIHIAQREYKGENAIYSPKNNVYIYYLILPIVWCLSENQSSGGWDFLSDVQGWSQACWVCTFFIASKASNKLPLLILTYATECDMTLEHSYLFSTLYKYLF